MLKNTPSRLNTAEAMLRPYFTRHRYPVYSGQSEDEQCREDSILYAIEFNHVEFPFLRAHG